MASKRGNPIEQPQRRIVLNQQVVNPQGNDTGTDKGQPGGLRVPQNKARTLNQKVVNPSVGDSHSKNDTVKIGAKKAS
jgi:hypothetical protein